jgi:hypothetical protein
MRSFVPIGVLTLMLAGCQKQPGSGLWNLKVGGEAKLVSSDGSDITLETFGAPTKGKASRRSPKTSKVEQVKLPAGTLVLVHAIDGDDARVEIKEGSSAGSIYWVECNRLEPVTR